MRIEVHGTVQGVGFRPFVYRLATGLGLRGEVHNAGGHVVVRAAGPAVAVDEFLTRLTGEAPGQSAVDRVVVTRESGSPDGSDATRGRFTIRASTDERSGPRELPPDLATCDACLRELFDPADRRFRYPFLNCTGCGPRATIVGDLPYDRARTAMRGFPMCGPCAAEYRDPANRRFHAEPTACPDCGPRLRWSTDRVADALAAAEAVIAAGGLVAVKGIGGYQLVCAADAHETVQRLRTAKHRPRKPFAVMVRDLAVARTLGDVGPHAESALRSTARPIVLVPRHPGAPVAGAVAPGLAELGVFLPYSPLHHLLLTDLDRPLVVTSGNRTDEPIAITDDHADAVLGPFVDGILFHERPIWSRYDDSVVRVVAEHPRVLRRARGHSPAPMPLPASAPAPLLAVGAQLKNTVTLGIGGRAVTGPHLGDLSDVGTLAAFEESIAALSGLHAVTPEVVAHDLHPGYLSTQHARRWWSARDRIGVQHHHAHVAATAAEHGVAGPFLGLAYDGFGLGDDGTLWGGELLLCDYTRYRRLARFATAPLPGGEAAVRGPARMALGYLFGAENRLPDHVTEDHGLLARLGDRQVTLVRRMIEADVNCPRASSAGRLFDAVAALLGLCDEATYEGEAAVLLEAAAARGGPSTPLRWRLGRRAGLWVYDPAPTLVDVITADGPVETVARRFHRTVTEVSVAMVTECARQTGVRTVCLGGGVFQNQLLAGELTTALAGQDLEVHLGALVPVNDGGVSYGQAAVAAATLREG
ncbi:hydrogenase maturation protein HypF [Actinophytocola oryzae]|uniref:Carbamoyltransferase n=1 Tax=Actinophytocola oryzae TaxID=502181 RepID=A0A4R7V616_9PSEU|nr:hydrogenase maturation protein HypF [Actinophytocola oryzae]